MIIQNFWRHLGHLLIKSRNQASSTLPKMNDSSLRSSQLPQGVDSSLRSSQLPQGVDSSLRSSQLPQGVDSSLRSSQLPQGVDSSLRSSQLPQGVDSSLHLRYSPLGDLPDEIILHILSYLEPISVYNVLFLNKRLKNIASDKHLIDTAHKRYLQLAKGEDEGPFTKKVVGMDKGKFIVRNTSACQSCGVIDQKVCRMRCDHCYEYFCSITLVYRVFYRQNICPDCVSFL